MVISEFILRSDSAPTATAIVIAGKAVVPPKTPTAAGAATREAEVEEIQDR